MVDTNKLIDEIYNMMKENDQFRNKYKDALVSSSQTTDRVHVVGEIYGKAIDRKLKLLELMVLSEDK